ncbi:mannitol dehydrogenase family protein [Microbacterium sp. 1P10AE]|uniref:mannitol dehydrogenase family protein n=1 Tax=Microbacterium sp. 1P10AE TaxID=3132286 RepID=UPI0039A1D9BC
MSEVLASRRLTRSPEPGGLPPERIVHLGLGAFHRAHQAWYTAHAHDAADWGIVAFTGRSRQLPELLDGQGGVYTLVERGRDDDAFEVVGSIVRAVPGGEVGELLRMLAKPSTAILTLTITEAGYRLTPAGGLDLNDPAVQQDVELVRRVTAQGAPMPASPPEPWAPATAIGRIVLGLDARRRAGAGPIALVPCDNLPHNGEVLRGALRAFAALVSGELDTWLGAKVSCVSTSVDRITPRNSGPETDEVLRATGWIDAAPVVAEPFSDWVLSGAFPAGRPAWETAGARFVDDIEPWENRKLWLLNGAHIHLASAGRLRGHFTVAEAIADPVCRDEVERFWDEAVRHLPAVEVADYRSALLNRFKNSRIEHRLTQIAEGGLTKLRVRIVPVARLERAAGRTADACARVLGTWIAGATLGGTPASLALIDPELAADAPFALAVASVADALTSDSRKTAAE